MNTKTNKIVFWISTLVIVLGIALPAALFINSSAAIQSMQVLGFPRYFGIELSIAKALGGLALILPMVSKRIKEWAYVGFGIDFISAVIANFATHQAAYGIEALGAFVILAVSYTYFHKING